MEEVCWVGGVSLSMCVALWRTDRGPVCAFAARPVWTRREDEIREEEGEEEGEDNTIRKEKKGRKKEKEKKKTGRQKTGRRRRGDGGCKRD